MLVAPLSSLSLARSPGRLRFLLPASAARVARLAMSTAPQAAAAAVSVEYAKSGRSTCKGCSGAIASGALRLGASTPDPRGFDATKWYHVACFPSDASHPLGPVESINGFDSIKEADREELHELVKNRKRDQTAEPSPKKAKTQMSSPAEGVSDRDHDREKLQELVEAQSVGDSNEVTEKNPEEVKNRDDKVDKTVDPLDEPSPKKVKAHMSSSMKWVSEKASVLVEYAKSGRSTCKGCSKNIAKGALRLGASAHDPRGYDSTKWYHVACFPASSYPLFPVENLKGFDSIKNNDREKLLELGENYKRDGNAADQSSEPSLKEEMVDSTRISKEGAENNLEEVKFSAGNNRIRPVISFSVSDTNKDYKGATLPTHWKAFETVIFREQEDGLHASAKIAAFDFDGCLAKTSVRIIGADKWSLQHQSIPKKLQSLYNDGYKLVIFTNESNIDRWKNKRQEAVDSKVGRLDNFIECVKVPIQVFIACGLGQGKGTPDDPYRKPNPGMWWLMAQHFNSGIEIDMDKSFYVGDAAGRENDHSDADIKFAEAIGLKFHVPEEYFGP
ncbi:polynucleotide 3'-phosphatase ZDP isoform X2 [Panicum hallii]|uniref:polynucleotide 3'-phosphatase ZDP isoform X2 n=1 Tax=Panicum hallii TaxID=206008 RepID=UPI000DF4EF59|nr:polynucleotide 3'-phosphatase ZDP isoform X2 [Panicum hallii]